MSTVLLSFWKATQMLLKIEHPPLQTKSVTESFPHEYVPIHGSEGREMPLVKSGGFDAYHLKFGASQKTSLHTRAGNHILIVDSGDGWLDYGGESYPLTSGDCYFVPEEVPHRIRASLNGLRLYLIADQHQLVNLEQRLSIIAE
jgi:mannose-6-phosphate isomerase-like protein (cupin superfamily)